jgi:uncharacterized protein DUF1848
MYYKTLFVKFFSMKTVISASRRTDIPAFYMDWFMDAIKNKSIQIQNPLFKNNYTTVDLSPSSVEWIVFWSRNYEKFLKNVHFFKDYNLFFQFTILSHHPVLEKTSLPMIKAISQMEKLVVHFGAERIIWRYDPIVFWRESDSIQTNFNLKEFKFLCEKMHTYGISKCYFSFVTNYAKLKSRFKMKNPNFKIEENQSKYYFNVLKSRSEIANKYQIQLYSCCNDALVNKSIQRGSCISGKLLNSILGDKKVSEAKTPTREDCGCTRSIDIGNYSQQPCYFGCIYCYANPVWK